ncbi:MAG TPA: SRPBCC family protein [Acidimicrobiales bacterium]|nr:SRPBCC family protein [Acidimicrobiales bacterium]
MAYPVAESREIGAPAERVWELVSDLPRMGEWSPENQGGRWIKGATGPALGAGFLGKNRNGLRRWTTKATVVQCEPGKVFEISITVGSMPVAHWLYEFEPTPGGCTVTESWDDHRKGWMKVVARPMGVHDADKAKSEMAATLANLARAAEHPA